MNTVTNWCWPRTKKLQVLLNLANLIYGVDINSSSSVQNSGLFPAMSPIYGPSTFMKTLEHKQKLERSKWENVLTFVPNRSQDVLTWWFSQQATDTVGPRLPCPELYCGPSSISAPRSVYTAAAVNTAGSHTVAQTGGTLWVQHSLWLCCLLQFSQL